MRRVSIQAIPPKRGVSKVTKKVLMEFQKLQAELKENPLSPYQAEEIVLSDLPSKKPNAVKHATLQLLTFTKQFIEMERLPYKAFTRQGGTVLYISGKPAAEAA